MTSKEKQIQLAKYRLKQAKESIEEAICLFSAQKSPRSIINRAYYGMFYAVLALIVFEPYAYSKHSGVLSYFNKKFIRDGIFSKEIGKSINKAFELRQRGDYREYSDLTYQQVEPFIGEAENFLNTVKEFLEKNCFGQRKE